MLSSVWIATNGSLKKIILVKRTIDIHISIMITRSLGASLRESLATFPVVGLLGPRQVGKTTLARELIRKWEGPTLFLDLERPSDLAKLQDPEQFLERHSQALVVLDEVQCLPQLFPVLRALVDSGRRPGRFLVLGSASPDLLRQSSESLAGRIRYLELFPFLMGETGVSEWRRLWVRGGFPGSYLAPSDQASLQWREAFIRTHLERDLPALGVGIPASHLQRFWKMLAHHHGQLWNASTFAGSLGISAPTVRRYLDVLEDTFMIRQLRPYSSNLGKRLVKSPRIFLRDCGLLHALLGIRAEDDLLGHPVLGASWEGWVVEQILARLPSGWRATFFRTQAGAELDLVLERPGNRPPLGIEIKATSAPSPTKGFWNALDDLKAEGWILCQAKDSYPLAKGVQVLPAWEFGRIFD